MTVRRFRWRPEQRVRSSADFNRTYAERCRGGDAALLLYARLNGQDVTRLGMSVSRKQHGTAVRRGRVKRLLREAFRLIQHELPLGLDIVAIPRPGITPTLELYQHSFLKTIRYLARKLRTNDRRPNTP